MPSPCYAPVFDGNSGFLCFFKIIGLLLLLLVLIVLYALTFGSASIRCSIRQLLYQIENCCRGNDDPNIDLNTDFEDWIEEHPAIRDAIVWQLTTRDPHPYSTWTDEEKAQLKEYYYTVANEHNAGLSGTPETVAHLRGDGTVSHTDFEPELAWEYFLAYVAQSLAAEIHSWIPWTVTSLNADELFFLFDSRSLFEYLSGTGRYGVLKQHNILLCHGAATPGDPGRTYAFLKSNRLQGRSAQATVENLLDWCRNNMVHFYNDFTPENNFAHWQYEGYPPVERTIEGTEYTGEPGEICHYTGGCWGTTGFLRTVLRTVNIPVKLEDICCHALPHFMAQGKFLSHGDDPYNAKAKWRPIIPVADILVDSAMLETWFGEVDDCYDAACDNVGRGVKDAVKQHLPFELLKMHCRDTSAGLAHEDGEVYAFFERIYSVAELEAEHLWDRIQAAIDDLGGCDRIP